MIKYVVNTSETTGRNPPDIFRAAERDDPIELAASIQHGQSLNDTQDDGSALTPLHVAILHRSLRFLNSALTMEFDPWLRDGNGRLAIDHARAQGMVDAQKQLFNKMYPPGWNDSPIVTL